MIEGKRKCAKECVSDLEDSAIKIYDWRFVGKSRKNKSKDNSPCAMYSGISSAAEREMVRKKNHAAKWFCYMKLSHEKVECEFRT